MLRYAIATGRAERNITADLRGALAPVTVTSRAAITDPTQVGELLRAIDGYLGQPVTHAALRLAPLLFVRPGELRAMEWTELDLAGAQWRIPASKMKMREAHIVPLSRQAVAILEELQPLTGHARYCFPSLRTADRHMSENTTNAALRRLGYDKATMCGHGFRAMASTLLNEQGWHYSSKCAREAAYQLLTSSDIREAVEAESKRLAEELRMKRQDAVLALVEAAE